MTLRMRAAALAAVAALIAALALLAGPLAQPARALALDVYTIVDFYDAMDTVNDTEGSHTITLHADLDFTDQSAATLQNNEDVAAKNLTIDGNGYQVSCDDEEGACATWLVNEVGENGSLTVTDIIVTGFRASAILNYDSDLSIEDSTFEDNANIGAFDSGTPIHGGAIRDQSSSPDVVVTVEGSVFTDNYAHAGNAYGGAIYTDNALSVSDSTFSNNRATGEAIDAWGGAISLFGAVAELSDVTFSDNDADAVTSSSYGVGGALALYDSAVYMADVVFEENEASGSGGAVQLEEESYMTVSRATFADNEASYSGGAVFLEDSDLDVSTTTFSGNEAGSYGGAIVMRDDSAGEISQSLFTDNSSFRGGALGVYNFSTLSVYATTFAYNEAEGGAVLQGTDADVEFEHVTMARNYAAPVDTDAVLGAQILGQWLDLSFVATAIVEPGSSDNCLLFFEHTVEADAYNRSDDATCFPNGGTDVASADFDAMLGELQFNGGPTDTMLPAWDSPLVDQWEVGGQGGCQAETSDQRDVLRPQDESCDIGAVETFEPIQGPVSTPGGTVWVRILNATDVDEPDVFSIGELSPAAPAGVSFPYGALGLEIEVWDDGWPVDVQVFSPAPTTQLWKLFDGEWVEPPGATHEDGEGGTLWNFRLTDGGFGDNDLTENAFIVDPVAAGVGAAFTG